MKASFLGPTSSRFREGLSHVKPHLGNVSDRLPLAFDFLTTQRDCLMEERKKPPLRHPVDSFPSIKAPSSFLLSLKS